MENRQKAAEKVSLQAAAGAGRPRHHAAGLLVLKRRCAGWCSAFIAAMALPRGRDAHAAVAGRRPHRRLRRSALVREQARASGARRSSSRELPNAVDIVVRGMKSGLPLNECLAIVARESAEPLAGEFREVIDQQRVGVPLGEALERLTQRMPLPEVRFLAIVVAIQQQAGGNLSEALGNLSTVLRDRFQLKMKVKALSAEAKASAWVLASLPPVVTFMVYGRRPNTSSAVQHADGQFRAAVRRAVDADRRSRHAQDDQLQVLSSSMRGTPAHPRGNGSGNASHRHLHRTRPSSSPSWRRSARSRRC